MSPIFAIQTSVLMLLFMIIFLALLNAVPFILFMRRYIRCPSDKVLVITGKTPTGAPEIIRSGAKFVWPLIQQYSFFDLQPMTVQIDAEQAAVKATATFIISESPECLNNAISRLLGLSTDQIKEHAGSIIRGQLLQSYDEARRNCDLSELALSVQNASAMPLQRLGLELLSLAITE